MVKNSSCVAILVKRIGISLIHHCQTVHLLLHFMAPLSPAGAACFVCGVLQIDLFSAWFSCSRPITYAWLAPFLGIMRIIICRVALIVEKYKGDRNGSGQYQVVRFWGGSFLGKRNRLAFVLRGYLTVKWQTFPLRTLSQFLVNVKFSGLNCGYFIPRIG